MYRLHGDWLYSKNMPERAVEMYIKTIGEEVLGRIAAFVGYFDISLFVRLFGRRLLRGRFALQDF